jgi:putative flippase GtrA
MERLAQIARRFPLLNESHVARQFTKFVIVGVTNTLWDYALYILLTRGWVGFSLHYVPAQLCAFVGSVLNSYILNKRWTFRHDDPRHHVLLGKFFLVNIVTLVVYEILLVLLIDHLGVYDLLAKAIAIAPVTIWNFCANKFWTFRRRESSDDLQK